MSVQSTTHKIFSYFYKASTNGESDANGAAKSGGIPGASIPGTTGIEANDEQEFGPSSIVEKNKGHFRAQERRRDFSSFHRAYSRAADEARFHSENRGVSGTNKQHEHEVRHAVNEGFGGLNLRAIMSFLHQLSSISNQNTNTTDGQPNQPDPENTVISSDSVSPQETVEAMPIVSVNAVTQSEVEVTPSPVTPNDAVISTPPAGETPDLVEKAQPQPENEVVQVASTAVQAENSALSPVEVEVVQAPAGLLDPVKVVAEVPVIAPINPAAIEPVVEEVVQTVAAAPISAPSSPVVSEPVAQEVSEVVPVAPATPVVVIDAAPVLNSGEVFEVSSAAGLEELLSQNISGGTIKLLAGDYVGVNFDGFNPATTVRIVSADSDNPTRMAKVNIVNSSNISFENIEFRADSNSESYWDQYVVRVNGSDTVDFASSVFSGGEGMQNAGMIGLYVTNSENVSVTGNEFTNTTRGAIFSNTNGLIVEGNNVHNIQTDGFNFVGVTDVLIDKNTFGDFYPLEGDHADYIQFWLVGADQGTEDVTISNNFMAQSGGGRVQGIFITGTDEFTNKNFVIENNSVYQSGYHGITISGVEGLIIQNNTVISSEEVRDTWIKVGNATNAQILNNITNLILLDNENTVVSEGNIIAKPDGVRGTAYTDLFKGILVADSSDPDLFARLAEIDAGADIAALLWEQEEEAG